MVTRAYHEHNLPNIPNILWMSSYENVNGYQVAAASLEMCSIWELNELTINEGSEQTFFIHAIFVKAYAQFLYIYVKNNNCQDISCPNYHIPLSAS